VKIRVTYSAVLSIENPPSGSLVDIDEGMTIAAFMSRCGIRPEHQRFIVPVVDGEVRRPDDVLAEGDDLNLLLPVGGG
jgi:sulfur carrier protein ThiS